MSKICRMCDKPIAKNRTYCSYKCSNNRPEHIAQAKKQIIIYNKSPEHRLVASKIGKKYGPPALIRYNKSEKHREYMRKTGSIIGTENLLKSIQTPEHKKQASEQITKYNKSDEHKEVASKVGKIYGPINIKFVTHEQHVKNGKIAGARSVKNGHIFKLQKANRLHKHIKHLSHEHFSTAEYNECLKHHSFFPSGYVHALVKIGSREVDWVIADPSTYKPNDPSTWLFVIEYHPPFWKTGETFSQYKDDRTAILRYLGVSCPILVYYKNKQWMKLASLYNIQCATVLEGEIL